MAISRIRRLAGNVTSLLTSEVVNRAATFVLYALIARYLGAFEFGQLSLAMTLFFISQVLAGAGLKTLITREVAKDRTKTDQYLINGSIIVIIFSLVSLAILWLFSRLMGYSPETTSVILLLSLGVLPFTLSVICKSVFRAWERMHFIVWANVPVNIAKVGVAFILLWQGMGVFELILLLLVSYVVILVIEWWLILRHITRPQLRIDRAFWLDMLRAATPFLGITIIVAISVNVDVILLSRFTDEAQVGLYGAAIQLITPLIVFYETIMLSVFPEMSRRFTHGLENLRRFSGQVYELLLAIAIPSLVGLSFLADEVFLLLYGNPDFVLASPALRILAWTLVLSASIHVLGRLLLASLREKITLRIIIISTLLKIVLGLILISEYGMMGAAVSALLTAIADFLLHIIFVSRLLFKIPLGRLVWKPVLASACMAVYLMLVRGQNVLLVILSASVLYAIIMLILVILSNGGPRQFRAKYQSLWSR